MTAVRSDMSDSLIHFTSGATLEEAFEHFRIIVSECRLLGGNGMIRGGHRCVCLSEAPLPLPDGLVNPYSYSRYRPFGILLKKEWVFVQGGRPVIYQSGEEYELLPEELKWRHVCYEPPVIDFTWEREWRIRCEELHFDPTVASLVLPGQEYVDALIDDHDEEQAAQWYQYAEALGQEELMQYREEFPWSVIHLGG